MMKTRLRERLGPLAPKPLPRPLWQHLQSHRLPGAAGPPPRGRVHTQSRQVRGSYKIGGARQIQTGQECGRCVAFGGLIFPQTEPVSQQLFSKRGQSEVYQSVGGQPFPRSVQILETMRSLFSSTHHAFANGDPTGLEPIVPVYKDHPLWQNKRRSDVEPAAVTRPIWV